MGNKKYLVDLSKEERKYALDIIHRLSGSSQKVRRANILLQADVNGLEWTDIQIASAYHCRVRTVENVRKAFVERGFEDCLKGNHATHKRRPRSLTGEESAELIALRLGKPPAGFSQWSLRLLARKFVELETNMVTKVSHETVRTVLKKTA